MQTEIATENTTEKKSTASPRPPFPIFAPTALVAIGSMLPGAYVFARALGSGSDLFSQLSTERTFELITRTGGLALAVTAAAIMIALPLALALARTDLPGKRFFNIALNLPLVIPSFLGAFAYYSAFRPKGLIQEWIEPLGVDRLPDIAGFSGALLVLTLSTYPYILLPVTAALRDLDGSTEEAARSLGASPSRALFKAVLPQVRPALASGALLVALYTLADFGGVAIMRYETLTLAIEGRMQLLDQQAGLNFASVLILLTLGIVGFQLVLRGPLRLALTSPGSGKQSRPLHLGIARWPAAAAATAICCVSLLIPVFILSYWTWDGIGSAAFNADFAQELWEASTRSMWVSLIAALVAIVAVLPLAVTVVRYPSRFSRIAERTTWSAYGLPGVVIAGALAAFTLRSAFFLYQTTIVLVLAYVVHFLPQALGSAQAALGRINPHLEEAARGLGCTWAHALRLVTLPLMLRGLTAGAILVFLNVMKELPVTVMLHPLEFNTLALVIWSGAQEPRFYETAGAAGLLLLVLASVPMGILSAREWHNAN